VGTSQTPVPVKLFVAIMYDKKTPIEQVLIRMDERFGLRECAYGPVPFSWTDYYEKEMGANLFKSYHCYKNLIAREQLPAIKTYTNSLEKEYAVHDRRVVNIDPGYISRDKLVLASTKDFYHRLYLADGIFGEVTLHYRKSKFRHFSWTYADYMTEGVLAILEKARASLVGELRKM
jgi:hypothetical protein